MLCICYFGFLLLAASTRAMERAAASKRVCRREEEGSDMAVLGVSESSERRLVVGADSEIAILLSRVMDIIRGRPEVVDGSLLALQAELRQFLQGLNLNSTRLPVRPSLGLKWQGMVYGGRPWEDAMHGVVARAEYRDAPERDSKAARWGFQMGHKKLAALVPRGWTMVSETGLDATCEERILAFLDDLRNHR